jgi:hypothetical protein
MDSNLSVRAQLERLREYASEIFQRLHGHQIAQQIRQMQKQLIGVIPFATNAALAALDARVNEPEFLVAEKTPALESASLAAGLLPQLVAEELTVSRVQTPVEDQTVATGSFNALQQSLAFSMSRIDADSLANPLIEVLWPFFKAVDDQLVQWASTWSSTSAPKLARAALQIRAALWNCASGRPDSLDISRLMVLARYLFKLTHANVDDVAPSQRLDVAESRLKAAFLEHFGSVLVNMTDALFKKGDKHIVFSTQRLHDVATSILGAASQFNWQFDSSDVTRVTPELWTLLVQSLATLHLLQITPDAASNDAHALLETMSLVPQVRSCNVRI